MKARSGLRSDARRAIKSIVLELAAAGASGRALARAVEAACPYDDGPRRRAWSESRRRLVGRLRHAAGYAREYVGVMSFSEGGD